MKARRLEFGYLRSISSADEKSFPMLIRTVSMKELLVIFPGILIGLILFLKHEVIYAAIPFMLAIYVLFYNEKSVPFYYQFLAFIVDFMGQKEERETGKEEVTIQKEKGETGKEEVTIQKEKGETGKEEVMIQRRSITGKKEEKKPKKPSNADIFEKNEKELIELPSAILALSAVLYIIQLEIYAQKINIGILIGLSVIAGLLVSFVIIKLIGLVSKR